MTSKEKKREHLRSLDDLEAVKATDHLSEIHSKQKIKRDMHNYCVLETAKKAHQFVEQSKEGYDKHSVIFECLTDRKATEILKKNQTTEKKQKKVQKMNTEKSSLMGS